MIIPRDPWRPGGRHSPNVPRKKQAHRCCGVQGAWQCPRWHLGTVNGISWGWWVSPRKCRWLIWISSNQKLFAQDQLVKVNRWRVFVAVRFGGFFDSWVLAGVTWEAWGVPGVPHEGNSMQTQGVDIMAPSMFSSDVHVCLSSHFWLSKYVFFQVHTFPSLSRQVSTQIPNNLV